MENNTWNPEVGTPEEGASQYDNSLNDDYQAANVPSGLSIPGEPVSSFQSEPSDDSGMWTPQGMDMQQQQGQQQLPEIPEAGVAGIDYDMGHIEKIGKSLMVGVGDMMDSFGDIADFIGGTPSSEISKQVFGVETNKPISDAFHNFADYLHSYGDDVPGLTDLQDITWDDLSDINFWETGVARMLPFALSLMIPASAAAKGITLLNKGKTFAAASKAIAAGGKSIGISKNISTAYNASKLIHTGMTTVGAGATANMIEGAAIAGQAMNEAILQGVDIKDAKHVGRQVFADNLASMGADIIQYGLFMGQVKIGSNLMKGAKAATSKVAGTAAGKAAVGAAGKVAGTKAGEATLKTLKNPKINTVIKTAFKSIGMGAANGITDGVVEQFQEVFQDWTVQRRIAEAKGEDFPGYLDFFLADEQRPTRVLSFATSLLMSGASNMISTATENRAGIATAMNQRAETHQLLDIFNQDIDSGVYTVNRQTRKEVDGKWVVEDHIEEMDASQMEILTKDTAARTILMNAVVNGDSEMVMEFFQAKLDSGSITEEQMETYKGTLAEIQESVQSYPVNNLNIDEKQELVKHAWINNVATKSLENKRSQMQERIEEIQDLVLTKKLSKERADKEISGLESAIESSLQEEKKIIIGSARAVKGVYDTADSRIAKVKFKKETAPKLKEIVAKEYKGEALTEEEIALTKEHKDTYKASKEGYSEAQAFIKLSEHVGEKNVKGYKRGTPNADGSTDFTKTLDNGEVKYVTVSASGEVSAKTVKSSSEQAKVELETEAQSEFDKFVDTGKVEKSTIERIASKIKSNKELTKEEIAMREGAAEEIEALLKSEVETKKETTETTEKTSKEYDEYGDKKSQELIELESQLEGKTGQERIDIQDKINRIIRSSSGPDFGLPSFQFIKNGKAGKSIRFTIADLKLFSKYVDSVIKEGIEKGWSAAKTMERVEMFLVFHGHELESLKGLDLDKLGDPQFSFLTNQTMGLKYYIEAQLGLIEEYGNNRQPFEVWRKPRVKSDSSSSAESKNDGYDNLGITKLKAKAKELGIKGLGKYKTSNKSELIELIREAEKSEEPSKGQQSIKFMKNARASAILAKSAAKAIAKKVFDKSHIENIIDFAERKFKERSIRRAFVLGNGSERALIDMLSKKSADGLISISAIVDESRRGVGFYGYAAGLGVFLDDDYEDETFFHENFHIFRDLYGHLQEVKDMMLAIVGQPIYNKVKLQYQENILYSVPTKAKGETKVVTQRAALESLNLKSEERIHSTIEDYAYANGDQKITLELEREFYEYASEQLSKEVYKELNDNDQTNIQDEALTQLAGIYGSSNQDIFLSDQASRDAYNESKKSWKEKISKAFTKEEASFSLEQAAGKDKYKKDGKFDLEEAFANVKDIIAKNEARYGNLSRKSPSFKKIEANREAKIMKEIEATIAEEAPRIMSEAKLFYKEDMPAILNEEGLAESSTEDVMTHLRAKLELNRRFNKAKVDLAKSILVNYKRGSKEFLEVYNVLFNHDKEINTFVEQMFLGAVASGVNETATLEEIKEMLSTQEEGILSDEENVLSDLISDKHHQIADKFYMILREFLKADKYIGTGEYDMNMITKESVMKSIRDLAANNRTEGKFRLAAERAIEKARANKSGATLAEKREMLMGNFFIFLTTEIDMSGGGIYQSLLLQFNSMITEKGVMISGDGFVPSETLQIIRKINEALSDSFYLEDEFMDKQMGGKGRLRFIRGKQEKKLEKGDSFLSDEEYRLNQAYLNRINLSKNLARLVFSEDTIEDSDLVLFLNEKLFKGEGNITVNDLDLLTLSKENGDRVSARVYFSKERLEKMLWDSISFDINNKSGEYSLETWNKEAIQEVFNPVFQDFNRKGDSLKSNISKEKIDELRTEFLEKVKKAHSTNVLSSEFAPYIANTFIPIDLSRDEFKPFEFSNLGLGDDFKFEDGYFDEEDGNINSREFFFEDYKSGKGYYNHVVVKKLPGGGYVAKIIGDASYKRKTSLSLFETKDGRGATTFNDLRGLKEESRELLRAKFSSMDDSHNANIRTPEGEMLNKNIRKYFLEYNKESLNDYLLGNKTSFASLFSFGEGTKLIMNPYAAMMAAGTYEMDYYSLDGDKNNDVDRPSIDNAMVSRADISEIKRAIKTKSKYYLQVVRDYSDKTRRYYANAETITSESEAIVKLAELVQYHENKTADIIARHNDPNDVFDIHLVTSVAVIEELRAEGYKISNDIKLENVGHTKKGELNLLGKRAFQLVIKGRSFDLSTIEGHNDMANAMFEETEIVTSPLVSMNYFINKFYLQDITSSVMEEQSFTMKNKRATGLIANHDSSYAGERVELLIFKDETLASSEMIHKAQVVDVVSEKQKDGSIKKVYKTREIELSADLMDSASYITEEEANRLIAKHGDIVDVKGSFKLVGYGKNVDNKKISSFFGQESNTFYAKAHTIVLNGTSKGPLKAVYKSLKAREKYYADNGLTGHSVIAYADSGVKKGSIRGEKGTPRNKMTIAELESMTATQLNKEMNTFSYDKENDIYGYDGRFFGIQGELDKGSKTATAAKQMIANINVLKGHLNESVSSAADKVIGNFTKALTHQYATELKGMSREDILRSSMDSDSTPIEVKAAMEDGRMSTPSLRASMLKLLTSKVQKIAFKIRTGGTLSLQESDVVAGYEVGSAGKMVQTNESLKPMTVVEKVLKVKDKKGKSVDRVEYYVTPAEAIISQHMAKELGVTQEDIDKGKEIRFLATRIPASSSGSTIVLQVAGISTKPGNTIAVNPLVSAIIGADLDGDMLHLNTIKVAEEGKELSEGDRLKNNLTQSIIDLFLMPDVQNSLTKELEFGTISKKTNKTMFDNESGSSDIANDFSLLGAHQMFGQTKGNGKMIGLIAAQNLVFSYLSEGNPNLFFEGNPISFTMDGVTKSTLDNSITEDGGGTWYELANWLNLILDDGKNNNRAKFQFVTNTGATFVLLIKMGFAPEKISKFLKDSQWAEAAEFVYDKTEGRKGELKKELKALLYASFGEGTKLKKSSISKLIKVQFSGKFNLDNMSRLNSLALYYVMDKINTDILEMSHFVGLDKHYTAEPIEALDKHFKAIKAINKQTAEEDTDSSGIGDKVSKDNAFFNRNKELNYQLISNAFKNDPYFSGGYGEALVGNFNSDGFTDKSSILKSETVTWKEKGDDKLKRKTSGIFKNTMEGELSPDVEANERMVRALNLTRAAIHSNVDVAQSFANMYKADLKEFSISEMYTREDYENLSREEKYGIVTTAVGEFLAKYRTKSNNLFVEHLDVVRAFPIVKVGERTVRVPMMKFKINSDKLSGSLDFTEQVRLIQKDFSKLPKDVQNFFVANDFLSTGWGSKPGSLLNFFSKEVSDGINETFKSLEDSNVSSFASDFINLVDRTDSISILRDGKSESKQINRKRMAIVSYMALYGADESLNHEGLFSIEKKNIGANLSNSYATVRDNHKGDNKEFVKDDIKFYDQLPQVAMLNVYGKLMYKGEIKSEGTLESNQDNSSSVKYHKVPVYEMEGQQNHYNIGQEMSREDFHKHKLPSDIDYEALNDEQKQSLDYQFEVYKASVVEVSKIYKEYKDAGIETANYTLKSKGKEYNEREKKVLDNNFNKAREEYNHLMDDLSRKTFVMPASSQLGLFEANGKAVVEFKLDELAANPLRRYAEYHFGTHISNKQILDWEFENGKDWFDEQTMKEATDKDISSLAMWYSPGDFGKGKPAIAYINKSMKMTHMKYNRNITLITKEMNERLDDLFTLKFGNGIDAKYNKVWMKYLGLGSKSIANKLFENLVEVTTELKEIVNADGETSYRDGSNITLKKGLFYAEGEKEGELNREENSPYDKLKKEEKAYLEMYNTYTSFYRGLIKNKELYNQTRGASYVPSVTSSRWETLQKRGLFGVYFQSFRGDQDISDIMITDINPVTGLEATLDYFSWKSIYMNSSSENIRTIKMDKKGEVTSDTFTGSSKVEKTSMERIVGLERIKAKAKEYVKSGEDALGNKVEKGSRVNDLMSLESEESKNRFNHKRSITASYLATENLHKSLRNYMSIFMFQHGNSYYEGGTYKHLHWNKDKREFEISDMDSFEAKKEPLMFTGFEDKKQEVDAAIAQLGNGKYFDPHANIGAGRNKRAINYLEKVVKRGLISKERGLNFSDFDSEADIANFFTNWTMYVALGLNVPAAIGNVAIGKYNAYRQMGGKKLLTGEARYWGVNQSDENFGVYDDTMRVKARKMIEEFGILTYRAEEIAEGTGGSSLSALIFLPMVTAENWIQQASFLGNITEEQWNAYKVDKHGDLVIVDEGNKISQKDLANIERDVINVQGRGYSETDARMVQLYALSNMTMQFKRWFPTFLKDRFGKEDIDDLGKMRMGSFPGAADFLTKMRDEGKMWNITEWNAELKAYGEKYGKHKQDAVMRLWRGTHGIVIIGMLLAMASKASDDDDKDPASKFMEKLLGDMLLVVNVPKLTYMANIPAVNTFKNLGQTIYHVAAGTEYQRKSKYGDKGDKRFVSNLAQLLPSPMRTPLQNKKGKKRSLR